MWHGKMLRCSEAMAEIIPKLDAEFATGVHQSEESVTTIATGVAVRATADLALDDVTANVALGTIGVQRYLWPVERGEQLGLVGMQSLQDLSRRALFQTLPAFQDQAGVHLYAGFPWKLAVQQSFGFDITQAVFIHPGHTSLVFPRLLSSA